MSAEQRRRFLLELSVSGNVNFSCRAAGVDRSTAYEYRRESPGFERMWRGATAKAREALVDRIEAVRRAEAA